MSPAGWVIMGLSLAVTALVLLAVIAGVRIEKLQAAFEDQQDANHAKCIAHIADFTSKRVVALNLRDLAERYNATSTQADLKRLVQTKWRQDGPSIPSLWMMEQADLLDPPPIDVGTGMLYHYPKDIT